VDGWLKQQSVTIELFIIYLCWERLCGIIVIYLCLKIFNVLFLYIFRYFSEEIDLAGMQVDMALRKFQAYFRMPVRIAQTL